MYEWDIHALELPYDDDSHSMYIVLPMFIEPRGISRIIEEVDDKFLRDVVLSPEWNVETIKVSLPKFNIEKYTDTLENVIVYTKLDLHVTCSQTLIVQMSLILPFCDQVLSELIF